ncbi:MAG: cytochrome b N-terminal domain-containing protein [Bacteroidota bacterium]|nr:cytochrome b N-terminal domain-containing protein [Candidatus Kapabacteria bacterium]MDW8219493.1 cytochrome b N-terminal domain-containing protein [Bacteroidota bacterium]
MLAFRATFAYLYFSALWILRCAALCFLLQSITGLLLTLVYEPSLRPAYTESGSPLVMIETTQPLYHKASKTRFYAHEILFSPIDTVSKKPMISPDTVRLFSRILYDTVSGNARLAPIAYYSVEHGIMRSAAFGWLIRGIHRTATGVSIVLTTLWLILQLLVLAPMQALSTREQIAGVLLFSGTVLLTVSGSILPSTLRSQALAEICCTTVEELPYIGTTLAALLKGAPVWSSPSLVRTYILHILMLPASTAVCWYILRSLLTQRPLALLAAGIVLTWFCVIITCAYTIPSPNNQHVPAQYSGTVESFQIAPEWYAHGLTALLQNIPLWSVSVGSFLWTTCILLTPIVQRFAARIASYGNIFAGCMLLLLSFWTIWEARNHHIPSIGFRDETTIETAVVATVLSTIVLLSIWLYTHHSTD